MATKQLGVAPSLPVDAARLGDVGTGPASAKGAVTTAPVAFPTTAAAVTELTFELAPGKYQLSALLLVTKSAGTAAYRVQIGDEDAVGIGVSVLAGNSTTSTTAIATSVASAPNTSMGLTTSSTTGNWMTLTGSVTVPAGAATWTVSIRIITSGTGTASLLAGSSASFVPITP